MKILILGHTGMLGNTVFKFFCTTPFTIEVVPVGMRWPSNEMKEFIRSADVEWIINCIGAIPQKNPQDFEYFDLNTKLPLFLFGLPNKMVIHAATDCEFSGKIQPNQYYSENDQLDATDLYGLSKAIPAEFAKNAGLKNVKIIRASIIGLEKSSHSSLLSWFLQSVENGAEIKGFNNHFWNGITTLEWAKVAYKIITDEYTGNIFQIATEKNSKYELLKIMTSVFNPGYKIIEASHPKYQNKCLSSEFKIRQAEELLRELKEFYHLGK